MTDDRGFIIADAVVALTILSLLLTALMGINGNSQTAAQRAKARLTATLIAQAVTEDRSIREPQGTIVVDRIPYTWTRSIETERSGQNDIVELQDTDVTVEWQVKTGQSQVELSTKKWRVRNDG